jgi:hypothetical protein
MSTSLVVRQSTASVNGIRAEKQFLPDHGLPGSYAPE